MRGTKLNELAALPV